METHSDGTEECFKLAFQWFLERGQFQFCELSLPEQQLFAKAAQLSDDGLLRVFGFLSAYNEARRQAALAAAPVGGSG
jgi:hypothetical protein